MLSKPTILSLAQYLDLQTPQFLGLLFEKHGLDTSHMHSLSLLTDPLPEIRCVLEDANPDQLISLLAEIARTERDLRYRISPKYRYEERLRDLEGFMELDGYRIEDSELRTFEPVIQGTPPLADDLHDELQRSELPHAAESTRLLDQAVEAFRGPSPDYNATLGDSRVALQSLAVDIADRQMNISPGNFDRRRWGQVLSYLRTSGFITQQEEDALAGVYSFLSEGAHRPVGLTERDMARLAVTLATAMAYFLVKRYNGYYK